MLAVVVDASAGREIERPRTVGNSRRVPVRRDRHLRVHRGLHFKETPDSEKDFGVHGGSDAAGLRVLLARVIDGE